MPKEPLRLIEPAISPSSFCLSKSEIIVIPSKFCNTIIKAQSPRKIKKFFEKLDFLLKSILKPSPKEAKKASKKLSFKLSSKLIFSSKKCEKSTKTLSAKTPPKTAAGKHKTLKILSFESK